MPLLPIPVDVHSAFNIHRQHGFKFLMWIIVLYHDNSPMEWVLLFF